MVATALLCVGVVAAALAIGVPLAWLVVRTDLPGRRFWGLAASLPLVIPSFVAALALLGALAPRGLLQQALEPLGVETVPELTGYWGALLALTLATYPYVFLLAAAGLRSVDPSAEEAARSLGAGQLEVFLRVTLPSLRPSLAAAALLVALYVLSDFGAVSLMGYSTLTTGDLRALRGAPRAGGSGDPRPRARRARHPRRARGRAVPARGAIYRSTPGAGRSAEVIRLGRWRWPALAFCRRDRRRLPRAASRRPRLVDR